MKEALSGFDVLAVVKDLQVLVGARIDKIYHPSLGHLVLSSRTRGEDKAFVHFRVGKWLYRSAKGAETSQTPSDFAMMLRKRISNARIASISQKGFDRIAAISIESEEKFELVLELFGDGNVILVKDETIVQPLTSHTWKHRDVRARKPFAFPPAVPDPATMSMTELQSILSASDTDLVRTIATKMNTGGRYAEEICARTGLDKSTSARQLTSEQTEQLLSTLKALGAEIASADKAYIVLKGGAVDDVVPTRMRIYEGLDQEEFGSFSEAIESYVHRLPPAKEEKPKESQLELERLKRKLFQQESAVTRLQDLARETQLLGDFLFANYGDVAKVLTLAKDNLLNSRDMKSIPGFVSFDGKSSLIDVNVNSVHLRLDVKQGIEENAQRYYEAAKKSRRKLDGLLVALDEARKDAEAHTREDTERASAKSRREPTKRFWFERFRWFVSSEGAVVLGGKDAKSNDMLVKKHLEAGDRYAHADVHGAPSVVVKMREGVTEKTLHEACEFAVATSRAWNAKIGSAAGYWVLPEQVSKTPQSGEYLAKGAFVIRGKRNYSDKLEIKLAIGEIEFEGSRKVMGAPESATRARSRRFVILRPGSRDKDEVAKKLADAFEVPIEEVQSVMPPGNVDIVEQVGLSISW